ncbi:UPF0389 protein CG9231-like [Copidosoma floridanum]|nr:UPF0389 protein CG9231-like [Copidosoma floridanum]
MPGRSMYKTTGFDRWILTWVKRYPKGQVPELISEDAIYQAKSKARVKAANYMMAATVLMCLGTVFYAKGLVKKGDSIQKRREDWHENIKEEARIERENTASK